MKPGLMKNNPAFLSQEELIQSFVVRQVDLDLIIETIKENTGNSNQHVLLIGPRGMGKTMLVLRAMAHINYDKQLNSHWYPVIFSEESYEVFTAAEFWLRAVFHLGKQTKDENLIQVHEGLKGERDEKRLYERALACLMDFADHQKKRLLLVVENINMLLEDQIGVDETWDIRHTLLNEPRIMLLGTAPSRFDEIDNAGKAMFDLFKIHHLEPLSTKDSKLLWEHLTGQEVEENKIRPIQILTGGNPRLLVIISSFAAGASFRELMRQLTFLIDEYTTYFKSNIEILPSLERKVFVTLANIWEPAEAARVARDARIDVNKTSSLLKRLENRGCVSIAKSSARKKSYQVTERLYNIYHLMRISGHQSDRVHAVVDFMVNFYEGKELAKKLVELTEDACFLDPAERRDHLEAYRVILQKIQSPDEFRRIIYSTKQDFFKLPDVLEYLDKMIDQFQPYDSQVKKRYEQESMIDYKESTEELLRKNLLETPKDPHVWLKYGLLLQEVSKKYNEAEEAFLKATEVDSTDDWAWARLGLLYHEKLERYKEAEEAYRKAIEINSENVVAWAQLGLLYHHKLDRYEEAESAYRKAIEINPGDYRYHGQLGILLNENLERYEEAIVVFREAIRINSKDYLSWAYLGQIYHEKLKRYEEAEEAYRKAIEIDPKYDWAWAQLGLLYHEKLERYKEAEEAYRKAIEINPKYDWAWAQLGLLYHAKLDRYEEAEEAYQKAIEINSENVVAWANLGLLLHERFEKYNDAEEAYLKLIEIKPESDWAWAHLGQLLYEKLERYEEAEAAYRKAIEINPKYDWAWARLGLLYHEKLERYKEAEEAYRKAIEISSENDVAWAQLGLLYHEKLERYEEAEAAYRKFIEINPKYDWAWTLLGKLLHEKLGRYEEAQEAYRKAIEINPRYDWAWVGLGLLYNEKLERYEEAQEAYRKFIEINPKYDWAWTLLGKLLHEKLEKYEEAEAAYRKAVEIGPNFDEAWQQLTKLQIERSLSLDHIIDTISQYLEITNRSTKSLNGVAWLIFESEFSAGFSEAEKMAQEAVEKEPDSINQHTYASILGAQGKWKKALLVAAEFLKDSKLAKEFPNDIIAFFIDAAVAGYAKDGLTILRNSACAPYMEPLIVALQMLLGEDYNAPLEVVEVAKDVLKKIEEKKKDSK